MVMELRGIEEVGERWVDQRQEVTGSVAKSWVTVRVGGVGHQRSRRERKRAEGRTSRGSHHHGGERREEYGGVALPIA
jgi:hypothetical protein